MLLLLLVLLHLFSVLVQLDDSQAHHRSVFIFRKSLGGILLDSDGLDKHFRELNVINYKDSDVHISILP